ncbi:MAG: hypothetical protein ACRDWT_11040 [Jatrophihabitantaceae bacterium]
MTTPKIHLDVVDATELAEALTFISDWLRHDRARLEASLREFVGVTGYSLDTLHADLARLAFLLGDDGTRLFGEQQP